MVAFPKDERNNRNMFFKDKKANLKNGIGLKSRYSKTEEKQSSTNTKK